MLLWKPVVNLDTENTGVGATSISTQGTAFRHGGRHKGHPTPGLHLPCELSATALLAYSLRGWAGRYWSKEM